MKTLTVKTQQKSYPIYIEAASLEQLPEIVHTFSLTEHPLLITDENVAVLYADAIQSYFRKHNLDPPILTLAAGEQSKSLQGYEKLIEQLLRHGATRRSTLLVLGGGVVGDVAGFAAATFLRGIRWVQIPTTLLAQIDSSVGGKVGINHPLGKNLIGAFYHPELVLIDPTVLKTLHLRERRAGAAEMVKYGLIQDGAFFAQLQTKLSDILETLPAEQLEEWIYQSCAIKAKIVAQDEREQLGIRAALNFGHTLAHALEAVTDYSYFRHGEAVTLGMAAATFLSVEMGYLRADAAESIYTLLRSLQPPAIPHWVKKEAIISHLNYDKKRLPSGQQWILLNDIGSFFISTEVGQSLVDEAIAFMKKFKPE